MIVTEKRKERRMHVKVDEVPETHLQPLCYNKHTQESAQRHVLRLLLQEEHISGPQEKAVPATSRERET